MKSVEQWIAEDGGPHFDIECEGCHEIIRDIQTDAQPQWQPIETAPREGSLLLWNGYVRGIGHWNAHADGSGIWLTDEEECTFEGCSHWMPLPEPPK